MRQPPLIPPKAVNRPPPARWCWLLAAFLRLNGWRRLRPPVPTGQPLWRRTLTVHTASLADPAVKRTELVTYEVLTAEAVCRTLLSLLIFLLLAFPAPARALDESRFLAATAAVETGVPFRPSRPGRAGEQGPYGLTFAVRVMDRRDAPQHLRWLERHLPDPTPYRLALAWQVGLDGCRRGRGTAAQRDRAQRVVNLLNDPTFLP